MDKVIEAPRICDRIVFEYRRVIRQKAGSVSIAFAWRVSLTDK